MRTLKELARLWTEALIPVCNNSRSHASQELKWLLQHAKQQSRILSPHSHQGPTLLSEKKNLVAERGGISEKEIKLMQGYVNERVKSRKPLQYILGTQPFMDLEILTRPPTLIPRWETEEWTARLAAMLKNNPLVFPHYHQKQNIHPSSPTQATEPSLHSLFNVLDICTGSGCIPLGLASALPQNSTRLFGVDIHPKAVQLARDNAAHNRDLLNQNPVQFHQADLLAPNAVDQFLSWLSNNSNNKNVSGANPIGGLDKQQRYNLIISNPPYIAHSEYDELEPEVAQWEDPKALLADQEGLVFYPRIANMAMELLDRQIAPYSSLPLSSRVSSSVTNENMDTNDTRELDPGTLERIGPLADNDSQSQGNINNSNDNNSIQQQYKSEDNIERTWRNGPELDRVKIPELVLEIGGDHQVDFVSNAVRQAGFRRVQVWKDLADRARCIVGAR